MPKHGNRTVAVAPTLRNVEVLGLIRTFLSFSLEVEIDGQLPWRRSPASGLTAGKRILNSGRPLADNRDEPDSRR
jgi:hypothetical protein